MTRCRRLFLTCLAACLATHARAIDPADPMTFLGHAELGADAGPDHAPFGGISGADYDPRRRRWLLISDDKSEFAPARYWTARIDIATNAAPIVHLSAAIPLRTEEGKVFPRFGTGVEGVDSESIRIAPRHGGILWSSEGDPQDGFGPAIRIMSPAGKRSTKLPLPGLFAFDPTHRTGPRPNLSIEGMTFADHGRSLWVSMEAPFYQDGPVATAGSGADVRLTRLRSGQADGFRQYAYPLEPIGPYPAGRLADNGVSEILAIDDAHLLVLERSGVQQADGTFRFRPRLYCASADGATDVASFGSLRASSYVPMRKSLVYDFTRLPAVRVDNVEAMSWGPPLPGGHRSLVFMTDNNFGQGQPTQILAFELSLPDDAPAIGRALCP